MDIKDVLILMILPVIGYLAASFNGEYDKYINAKERYFKEFLSNFYNNFRKGEDTNSFLILNYNYSLYFVPPYISYLLEQGRNEEIRKILLVDYYDLMPSYKNIILNTISKALNSGDFFTVLMLFIVTVFIAMLTILLFGLIGFTNQQLNVLNSAILIISIIISTFIIKKSIKSIIENNIYSNSEVQINKIIKNKIKCYKKLENDLYFLNNKQTSEAPNN